MHCALQGGTLVVEIDAFIKANRIAWSDLEDYLKAKWVFPLARSHKGKQLHRIFSAWRRGDDEDRSRRAGYRF